jgi:phage-related minor tail protein
MGHVDLVQPRCLQGQLQGVGDILGFHGGAKLRGDDVAREVVKTVDKNQPQPVTSDK